MENVIYIDYNATNENSEAFIQECFNRYGNRIVFVSGDGITLDTTTALAGGQADGSNGWFKWVASMILLAGVGTYMMINRIRRIPAMQTVNGTVVVPSSVPSKKAVIEAIKKNESIPSQSVFQSILDKIDNPSE